VAVWVATALVAGGLFGAALAAGRAPAARPIDRLLPDAAGTTWLYNEVTNGKPTGHATVRVMGAATLAVGQAVTPTQAVAVHFDDFLGRGQPRDEVRYQAKQGDRSLLFGVRSGGSFGRYTPAQTLFELPLARGRSFTWKGTQDRPKEALAVSARVVATDT
jgi:hypothetical protein